MKIQLNDQDANTYRALQDIVNGIDYSKGLEFDFKDVEYISSAGLRVLLSARKKAESGNMKVINVSDDVYSIFVATGFDSILDVERGEEGIATYISRSFKEILKMKSEKFPDVTVLSHLSNNYTWKDIEMCAHVFLKS